MQNVPMKFHLYTQHLRLTRLRNIDEYIQINICQAQYSEALFESILSVVECL